MGSVIWSRVVPSVPSCGVSVGLLRGLHPIRNYTLCTIRSEVDSICSTGLLFFNKQNNILYINEYCLIVTHCTCMC